MVSIQVDEQTAKALEAAATEAGIPLSDFLRSLLPQASDPSKKISWDVIEQEISDLSIPLPSTSTFPRSELYSDHD